MTVTTSFGGLSFSTDATTGFTITKLDGWYSGPPVRSDVEDRPNADGAFGVSRVYKGARVITQTGMILAGDEADAMSNYWLSFAALQADGAPSAFSVTDETGTKTAEVTLAAPPEVDRIIGGAASYTLQMVARDPIKYGPDAAYTTGLPTSGGGLEYNLHAGGSGGALYYGTNGELGRVELTNTGTASVWPSVVVSGALTSGFYLQRLETGDVVRYDRVVPAGSTVSIDFRTGEVLVDSVSDGSTYLTRDEFFSVAPGEVAVVQFNAISGSTGTPTATFTLPSGWF